MPFEKEYLNLGGGMNLASGVFTAPKAGTYAFSFKGLASGTFSTTYGWANIFIQKNNVDFAQGYSAINGATSNTYPTFSVHATVKLNKGDTISIRLDSGTVYSYPTSQTEFTGSLIEEDLVIS